MIFHPNQLSQNMGLPVCQNIMLFVHSDAENGAFKELKRVIKFVLDTTNYGLKI